MRSGGTRAHAATGFTLIEILAAVFLTSVVLALAVASYIHLSNATETAQARTRDSRHALAILDRMARDLEGAYLLKKPPELDPLFHPWIFLAESHTPSAGADRLKFITRNYRPRNPVGHGSDLAVVSYVLEAGEDGRFLLTRSVSPGLPEELDRTFYTADDDRAMVVAEDIASLSMRFLNDEQQWVEEWDSSLIEESGNLPLAAEIDVSLVPATEGEDEFAALADLDPEELEHFTRRVLLPLRPVDLEAITIAAADAAGVTIGEEEDYDDEGDHEADHEADDTGTGTGESSADMTDGDTLRDCLADLGLLGVAEEELTPEQQEEFLGRPVSDPMVQAVLSRFGVDCE